MNTGHPNLNSLWADLIVEELIRSGVSFFSLSPGSRSTPLVAAVATHAEAHRLMHFDERGAAFCALGYARATGRPAALISTSGTAAANYYPAVVEAAMDHLPLIVLTADRPPELLATGANQTIDQISLFSRYPRWFFDLPCPDEHFPPQALLTTIDQACARSLGTPPGPVHLNCHFREPLEPTGPEQDFTGYLRNLSHWQSGAAPFTRYHHPAEVTELPHSEEAGRLLTAAQQGLILVGRLPNRAAHESILKVARALRWPILADIASGLRGGNHQPIIPSPDLLLASDPFAAAHAPDTVLHFGPPMTAKRISRWLASVRPAAYLQVTDTPERSDPDHLVTHRFEADLSLFCSFLLPYLTGNQPADSLQNWSRAATTIEPTIERILSESGSLSEPLTARLVSQQIRDDSALFVASSMPIRDLDLFAHREMPPIPIGANRGASGIDGTIASAVGFSRGHNRRVTLLIGDLALLHDLNSLALLADAPHPMTIVLLNNNGGGIFHFLPISQRTDLFEQYWGTPHHLTFESAATLFGLAYATPATPADFTRIYTDAQTAERSTLIEVRTDRAANHALHERVLAEIVRTLEP